MIFRFFSLCLVFLYCSSCKDSPDSQLKIINEGLSWSNKFIEQQNKSILEDMKDKMADAQTQRKASFWYPKADSISRFSKLTLDYIDSIISILKTDRDSDTRNIVDHKTGNELFQRLLACKMKMLNVLNAYEVIESPILSDDIRKAKNHFIESMPLLRGMIFQTADSVALFQKWFDDNFPNTEKHHVLAILNKSRNDILLSENTLIDYCSSNVNTSSHT